MWTPEMPHLYQADIEARQGEQLIAEYHGTIGLRRLGAATARRLRPWHRLKSAMSERPTSRYDRQARYAPLGRRRPAAIGPGSRAGLRMWCAGIGHRRNACSRRRGFRANRRPRFSRAQQPAAAGAVRRARRRRRLAESHRGRQQAPPNQFRSANRARRCRRDASQHRRIGGRRRRNRRRHRQLRHAIPAQRFRRETRQAVGLRRLHRRRRPNDDDPARRNRLPRLPDGRRPAARAPRPPATRPASSARSST